MAKSLTVFVADETGTIADSWILGDADADACGFWVVISGFLRSSHRDLIRARIAEIESTESVR